MILNNRNVFLFFFGCLIFLSGVAASEFNIVDLNFKCSPTKYSFLNKSLVCDYKPIVDKSDYTKLKNNLENFITWKKQTGDVTGISIYFRDLQFGPTFGINSDEEFAPASLLKLPILITYYSLNEDRPEDNVLNQEITYQDFKNLPIAHYKPKVSMLEGKSYKINDLLDMMVKYSDNVSYYALTQYLQERYEGEDLLKQTYVDLGIIDPTSSNEETISVKSYAGIFVQLYNATAFNKKHTAQEALTLLSQSDFKSGIAAGVPTSFVIAHKFGERNDLQNGLKQLHDCGIVYYPGNPYLLCVMTRGYDFDKLADTISAVSRQVYEEFNSRKL